jgi:hypothetical protein
MGGVNRTIIASVVIIMAAGIFHLVILQTVARIGPGNSNKYPLITGPGLTRVIVGAWMLGLIASIFDLIGSGVGQIAGWLLMLAVGVAVLTTVGDFVTFFGTQQPGVPPQRGLKQ